MFNIGIIIRIANIGISNTPYLLLNIFVSTTNSNVETYAKLNRMSQTKKNIISIIPHLFVLLQTSEFHHILLTVCYANMIVLVLIP